MSAQPAHNQFLQNMPKTARTAMAPLQREFNRFLDEISDGWAAFSEIGVSPRIDIKDTKDAIEVSVELPGMSRDDVSVSLEDDVLTISGEKKAEKDVEEKNFRVAERHYGAFSRSIVLPRGVDAAQIDATMSQGVLKVTAPKDGAATSRTITVHAAK